VHPKTGLVEFACGPSCDRHAGGSPGEDKAWHRFHRVLGGFLSVAVGDGRIVFRRHDVFGQVAHQWQPD
jgi:alkaline phosphatase D